MTKTNEGAQAQPASHTAPKTQSQELALLKKTLTDQVMERVSTLSELKELSLPPNYEAGNALQAAWFVLMETKDRDQKPVLDSCDKASIANALFKMVVKGLSATKKQCYFIAYGNQLTCQESYMGNLMLAKRDGKVVDVNANCIFEGDTFRYEVDINTGRQKLLEHSVDLGNRDITKIKGAYAIVIYEDGHTNLEVMNMQEIKTSWEQGASRGKSPAHMKFTDQMAKRTVINRACKVALNSSDDSAFMTDDDMVGHDVDARNTQIKNTPKQRLNTDPEPADNQASAPQSEPQSGKRPIATDVQYEEVRDSNGQGHPADNLFAAEAVPSQPGF